MAMFGICRKISQSPSLAINHARDPKHHRLIHQRTLSARFLHVEIAHRPWSDYKSPFFFLKTWKPLQGLRFLFSLQASRNLEMESSRESIWPIRASSRNRGWWQKVCMLIPSVPQTSCVASGAPPTSLDMSICLWHGGWARSLTVFFRPKVLYDYTISPWNNESLWNAMFP